ncbi:MAG: DUF6544 family protein [Bacteroidales bacterium]
MKYIFAALLFIHGAIHLMGFAKAFGYGENLPLSIGISRGSGILWLVTFLLFTISAVAFLYKADWWLWIGMTAALLSMALIITAWNDAKFGSIANIIILVVAVLTITSLRFEMKFKNDVLHNLERTRMLKPVNLTESDLLPLPEPVQQYLRYAGVVNKPKVKNFRVVFEGEMRSKGKDWFPFTTVQYNFFDEPTRLFYMKGKMFGLTVPGYHRYIEAKATMDIRLFGLFSVVAESGAVLDKTETVTLFNDMCLLAPATLIDKRIQWKPVDSKSVAATFTNHGISITAMLYFNEKGQLINFLSNERTALPENKQYPFTTPVYEYKSIDNRNVVSNGDAVYDYPDGKFVYGKFRLKEIAYNVNEFQN